MPTLRRPVSGWWVKTAGRVMKGPPSSGQQVRTGILARSMSSPVSTTSWHGPRETSLGNMRPNRASWGRSFSFFHRVLASASMKPRSSPAMSSRESTSRAMHMRRMEPKAFISTGIS